MSLIVSRYPTTRLFRDAVVAIDDLRNERGVDQDPHWCTICRYTSVWPALFDWYSSCQDAIRDKVPSDLFRETLTVDITVNDEMLLGLYPGDYPNITKLDKDRQRSTVATCVLIQLES